MALLCGQFHCEHCQTLPTPKQEGRAKSPPALPHQLRERQSPESKCGIRTASSVRLHRNAHLTSQQRTSATHGLHVILPVSSSAARGRRSASRWRSRAPAHLLGEVDVAIEERRPGVVHQKQHPLVVIIVEVQIRLPSQGQHVRCQRLFKLLSAGSWLPLRPELGSGVISTTG